MARVRFVQPGTNLKGPERTFVVNKSFGVGDVTFYKGDVIRFEVVGKIAREAVKKKWMKELTN